MTKQLSIGPAVPLGFLLKTPYNYMFFI